MPGHRKAPENCTLRQRNRKLEVDNQQLTERLKAARENNRFLGAHIAHIARVARLEAEVFSSGNELASRVLPSDGTARSGDASSS